MQIINPRSATIAITLACVCIAGCDVAEQILPVSNEKKTEAIRQQAEKQRQLESEKQLASESAVLKARGKALVATATVALNKAVASLAEDVTNSVVMAGVIDEIVETKKSGAKSERYEVLTALLGNKVINELARRYLNRNFNLDRLALEDEYQKLGDIHRERRAQLTRNAESEAAAKKNAEQGMVVPVAGKNGAVERLRREIASAEKEYAKAKHELETTSGAYSAAALRNRRLDHLNLVESRLRDLRSQYDAMKSATAANVEAERSRRVAASEIATAKRQREQADLMVERRFGKLKSSAELISEYEKRTMEVLRNAIDDNKKRNQESVNRLETEIAYFKSIVESSDINDAQAVHKFLQEVNDRMKKGFGFD